MKYYSVIKKDEILLFATTCVDLEDMMLSEMNQADKNTYHVLSLIYGIKMIKLVNSTEKKQTHRYSEQTIGYQSQEGSEEEQDGVGV